METIMETQVVKCKSARKPRMSRRCHKTSLLHRISTKLDIRPSLLILFTCTALASISFLLFLSLTYKTTNHSTCLRGICPHVLRDAVNGDWVPVARGNSSGAYPRGMIFENMRRLKKVLGFPLQVYRNDLRCGPAHFIKGTTTPAECNPNGANHCCNEDTGWCGSTVYHCNGKSTMDYEEEAKQVPRGLLWKPRSEECKMVYFDRNEACQILSRTTSRLVFIGGGSARNLFTMFILFLSGNFRNGALKPNVSASVSRKCHGEYQLLNLECHPHLVISSLEQMRSEVCPGTRPIILQYIPEFQPYLTNSLRDRLKDMKNHIGNYVILDNGYHFDSNHYLYLRYFLQPFTDYAQPRDNDWPVVIANTLPYARGAARFRRDFNSRIIDFSKTKGISILDNYPLSIQLKTFDGRTFGYELYFAKLQILLHRLGKDCSIA